MQAASKAPKYFGVYRTKRELLSAIKAQHELFFSRDTNKFFKTTKYEIETEPDEFGTRVILVCHNRRPLSISSPILVPSEARYHVILNPTAYPAVLELKPTK
jgi:hypothetical protein